MTPAYDRAGLMRGFTLQNDLQAIDGQVRDLDL